MLSCAGAAAILLTSLSVRAIPPTSSPCIAASPCTLTNTACSGTAYDGRGNPTWGYIATGSMLLDRDATTQWNPGGLSRYFNDWWCSFEGSCTIASVALQQDGDTDHDATAATWQASPDGTTWTDVAPFSPMSGSSAVQSFPFAATTAEHWRLHITATTTVWKHFRFLCVRRAAPADVAWRCAAPRDGAAVIIGHRRRPPSAADDGGRRRRPTAAADDGGRRRRLTAAADDGGRRRACASRT
eukprot:gene57830-biopygen2550